MECRGGIPALGQCPSLYQPFVTATKNDREHQQKQAKNAISKSCSQEFSGILSTSSTVRKLQGYLCGSGLTDNPSKRRIKSLSVEGFITDLDFRKTHGDVGR